MKRAALALALVMMGWSPAAASDRMTDRDVKSLVTRVEQGWDRFDDALDDKLKQSVLRVPTGDVGVKNFLNDVKESIKRLENRLKPEYTAGAEAATVLRQASAIDRFFTGQAAGTRGESEWNRLATDLKALARAYGADFPLQDNAVVRRTGDRELAVAIDGIAKTADSLKRALDNDLKKSAATDPQMRQAAVGEADLLAKDAKEVRDRVKDGEPSSGEADRLLARATKMEEFLASHSVPGAAGTWKGATSHLASVASAYGISWPAGR
jgi:hypothetical protein